MVRLRVGSFNLFSGRSLSDGQADPDRLAAAVAELDVDLLAVQEVDRGQPRSGRVEQVEVARKALRAADFRYVETVHGTPGEPGWTPAGATAAADGRPGYGIALLSRLPVAEWHELRLPAARGRYPIPIPSRPPRLLWITDEPRVVLAAVLEQPRLTVACTHLSFVPPMTAFQLRRARRWLERLPGPHLLLGDLNLPAGAARRLTGWTPLVTAPTYPAPAPRLQLDHALIGGLPPGSRTHGRAILLPISDHRAVVADLQMPSRAET